jgi:hypothetical protein
VTQRAKLYTAAFIGLVTFSGLTLGFSGSTVVRQSPLPRPQKPASAMWRRLVKRGVHVVNGTVDAAARVAVDAFDQGKYVVLVNAEPDSHCYRTPKAERWQISSI